MADDERKGFWKRLKEKLTGGREPADQPDEQGNMPDGPQGELNETDNEANGLRPADPPQAQPPKSEPTDNEPTADKFPEDESPEDESQTHPPPSPPTTAQDGEPSVLSTSELKTDNVGRVYAEALLELAQAQGVVDELADEVQQLLPVIDAGGELHRLLTNPAIGDEKRGVIVKEVFEGKVSGLLYNLLRLLGDKGRLGSLPQVAAGYLLAVAELRGQVDVQAFVATELSPDAQRQVADQIGQALGKTVSLTQKVDPSLIGGLKIKVGDQLIDASVASQLRNMKQKMIAAGRS